MSIVGSDSEVEIVQSSQIEGVSLIGARYKTPRTTQGPLDIVTITYTIESKDPSPANIASTRMTAGGEKYELSSEGALLR